MPSVADQIDLSYLLERSGNMDSSEELICDLFAGGGGWSSASEMATGMSPHIAINHNPKAVAMHQINHPDTKHYTTDIFEINPITVTKGKPVGLLLASPDCTHFSIARGSAPVSKRVRSLAWVICRWGGMVSPRVIIAENVKEIQTWGPLVAKRDPKTGRVLKKDGSVAEKGERVPVENQLLVPDKKRAGQTYKRFIKHLKSLGYEIETRELVAADYGAPTIRKRWFMIARCDGEAIKWPEQTHAKKGSEAVKNGEMLPWVPVSTCIDWSLPAYSIFLTKEEVKEQKLPCKRPLAPATMDRIAKGCNKYVIDDPEPFIVHVQNASSNAVNSIDEPIRTITAHPKGGGMCVAIPFITKNYTGVVGQALTDPIGTVTTIDHNSLIMAKVVPFVITNTSNHAPTNIDEPLPTLTTGGQQALVLGAVERTDSGLHKTEATENDENIIAAHVYRDFGQSIGSSLDEPIGTITGTGNGKAGVIVSFMTKLKGTNIGEELNEPLHTITAGGLHHGIVSAYLVRYHGSEKGGRDIEEPIGTLTSKDEYALAMTVINGESYCVVDILLRMLSPRELYLAQGFPPSYIIDRGADGELFTVAEQVSMCGNSVSPILGCVIIKANYQPVFACVA